MYPEKTLKYKKFGRYVKNLKDKKENTFSIFNH